MVYPCKYPWNDLKKPGDSFVWKDCDRERTLRVQAVKLGRRRGVIYSVRKRMLVKNGKPFQGIIVTLEQLVL